MAELCPAPLNCSETYGELVIDAVTLHGPAWCAWDLSPLYDSPEFRDDNILVERLPGRVARPTVIDETDYSLRLMFSGYSNQSGSTVWTDAAGGLLANRRTFVEQYIDPIQTGDADLPATLTVPDGAGGADLVYVFACQPLRLSGFTLLPEGYARAVLELRLPVPYLVEPGP